MPARQAYGPIAWSYGVRSGYGAPWGSGSGNCRAFYRPAWLWRGPPETKKKPGGAWERLRARQSLESEQQLEDTGFRFVGLSSEGWNCELHRKSTPGEKDDRHGEHRMVALRQNIRRLVR
jgi:hypothetical protein